MPDVRVRGAHRRNIALYAVSAENATAEQISRALICYGICGTLFPNADSTGCYALLGSLVDLSKVGEINWAAAGLAEIYFSLDKFSKGRSTSHSCF